MSFDANLSLLSLHSFLLLRRQKNCSETALTWELAPPVRGCRGERRTGGGRGAPDWGSDCFAEHPNRSGTGHDHRSEGSTSQAVPVAVGQRAEQRLQGLPDYGL